MRWYTLALFCVLLTLGRTEPDPKKYKPGKEEKLTNDERQFLREVEEKFGVKSDVPSSDDDNNSKVVDNANSTETKPLFPAVIAIEIFNDTDSKSKGKRTIDANLGYGYNTDNGYKYTYFGKPGEEKGKFMIYPYSQEDIPAGKISGKYSSKGQSHVTSVEIQPSQAFELVQVNQEENGYNYKAPANPLKTKYEEETEKPSQILYTTYNGQEFSGLSGQFPKVMSNYLVDPNQLLKNPQYQSVGLTQDHLKTQNTYIDQHQRIVPVLVLRVPSSYLKNPSAELYADLPNNYPLSQYLNTVNLQEMVNQYFKKSGFSFAPQIMAYQNLLSQEVSGAHAAQEHYANPQASPAYTQADYSGLQYSAVKPVMAKYPSRHSPQKYVSQTQIAYKQPEHQQYQYQYVYEPQTGDKAQMYQYHSKYQQTESGAGDYQNEQAVEYQDGSQDISSSYGTSEAATDQGSKTSPTAYETDSAAHGPTPSPQYGPASSDPQYESASEDYSKQAPSSEYGPVKISVPTYDASQYYSPQSEQNQGVVVYPSHLIHSENYQVNPSQDSAVYMYNTQASDASNIGLSENYPTKDHTIATVYPNQPINPSSQQGVQSVSYVTPTPTSKYQSQFRIMVPQTILTNPSSQKSTNFHYMQQNSYNQGPVSDQAYRGHSHYSLSSKTHPHSYYTYSKRMVKPDRRPSYKSTVRKTNQKKTTA